MSEKFGAQLLTAMDTTPIAGKLSNIIKDALADVLKGFDQKLNDLHGTINLLRNELQARDATITALQHQNDSLKQSNSSLLTKMKTIDAATRRDNLIFSGLTATYADAAAPRDGGNSSTQILKQVVDICNKNLGCLIKQEDISYVQLLPSSGAGMGAGTRSCSATIKFVRRSDRDSIFFSKTKLAASNKDKQPSQRIYINEDLIPDQRKLLNDLRQRLKDHAIQNVWSKYGNLFVKMLSGNVKQINSLADLNG